MYLARVEVVELPDAVRVRCPYTPFWPQRARRLGGRWDGASKEWVFDPRDRSRVREALIEEYGWDGTYPVEVMDLRLTLRTEDGKDGIHCNETDLWFCGRPVARRTTLYSRVRLGPGVVIVEGGFPPSGGSRKHPALEPEPGTVVELRDVPVEGYERRVRPGGAWADKKHLIVPVDGSRRTVVAEQRIRPPVASATSSFAFETRRRILL